MMNGKQYIKIIQAGLLSLAFFLLAYGPVNDPDFGWHLRSGMYYLDHWSVPTHDIFSWTAPNYPWVNHEYGADAAYAFLYRLAGNTTILLSLLFAAIAAYLFLSVLPRLCVSHPNWKQRFLIGFPAFLIAKPFFGVRSQVFDWLGIALILLIWQKYEAAGAIGKNKILWVFPLLFFVWANVHAGFPLGLLMLAGLMLFYLCTLYIQCHSRERGNPESISPGFPIKSGMTISRAGFFHLFKEHHHTLFLFSAILFSSFLATFLTAYHYHLYADLIRFSQNKEPLRYIIEWAPSAIGTSSALPFFCYLFFLILILFEGKEKKEVAARDILFFVFFLFFALSYVRFIPLFAIVSLPIAYRRFADHQLMPEALAFVILAAFIAEQVSFFDSVPQLDNLPTKRAAFVSSPLDIKQKAFYADTPIDALAWLKTQKLPPRMFNTYDWGGEIIWQMPDQPVFVDGRMPYWRLDDHSLLQDYIIIKYVNPKWYETIQRYDIQWFFIPKDSSLAAALKQLPEKWQEKYQDRQAVIFFKKGL